MAASSASIALANLSFLTKKINLLVGDWAPTYYL